MTANGVVQLVLFLVVLLALAKPLGEYMARVYDGKARIAGKVFGPLERLIYRACGVSPDREMGWKIYATAMLVFNLAGILVVYLLLRLQDVLPLNPEKLAATSPDLAFNIAVSFATNTNWQSYAGESTLGYLVQMAGLTVQNFVSAGAGMACLVALVRGISRNNADSIGNFWVDLTRSTLYVLVPLSVMLALVLVSQGVVQNLSGYQHATLLSATADADGKVVLDQIIPMGPAASQIAIKQLGTNGGGFFNVNSAHPFENPTPLANFVELLSILLIGAALCHTFGAMVKDRRQGWAILAAMTIVFVALLVVCVGSEQAGNPLLTALGVDPSGGNMEGKEVRFGITNSALWATATTAASNGSVNAMHDSFTPLGGMVPMWLMQLGEVIYGGVGSGLYGMLMFVIVAVFIAGLMVGRTPEYLGKKIEAYEMKMAAIAILVPCVVVLIGTAIAISSEWGSKGLSNPGIHGFSEVLYAFSSAGNNNGSAFGGLTVDTPPYNTALGLAMLFARYWVVIPALAVAGSLARKKLVPVGSGTLPTHTPLFVTLLIGTVLLVGALTFIPALALGPIVEHLVMVQ
jgi:potassium-transporting ATPase potassium-binding subunit